MLERNKSSWVLILPFLVFGLGVGLDFQTENEARAQFDRAQEHWRAGRYPQAIRAYRGVYESYPESRYAIQALWESATLNYLSSIDLGQAIDLLQRITREHPSHPLADQAFAMLAEIHESAFQDPNQALLYWMELDRPRVAPQLRRHALYRTGRALFELSRFDEAKSVLIQVCDGNQRDYLAQQANLRLGIMHQLQERYEQSLGYFLAVLAIMDCTDCRLQAQLGLIESYEFLNDLDSAVKIAHQLDLREYPLKQELLDRLQQKRHYYQASTWNK